jgi:hypothetical protein
MQEQKFRSKLYGKGVFGVTCITLVLTTITFELPVSARIATINARPLGFKGTFRIRFQEWLVMFEQVGTTSSDDAPQRN